MDYLVIVVAFFFALLMCLGLILMKWIISQLGAVLFAMILCMVVLVFLLAVGDKEHEAE